MNQLPDDINKPDWKLNIIGFAVPLVPYCLSYWQPNLLIWFLPVVVLVAPIALLFSILTIAHRSRQLFTSSGG